MEGETSTTAAIESGTNQTRATQTQTPPTRPSTATLRTNWIYFLRASWQRISRTSKVILGTTLLIGIAQIVITIVMLIVGKNEQCDRPLDIYLIVFLIRLSFSLPLLVYQHLRPLHSGEGNTNSTATMAAATVAAATTRTSRSTATPAAAAAAAAAAATTVTPTSSHSNTTSSSTTHTPSPSPSPLSSSSSTSTRSIPQATTQSHTAVANTHTLSRPTIPTRCFLDRIKSFLDLISILWFVVGNYLIFTASDQCHRDASHLFYTTLTWILLGYFLVLIPLLLCATVVFCLPCLLVAMRTMNVDYATGMVGANKNEIQSIPVYKYKSSTSSIDEQQDLHHAQEQQSTSASHVSVPLPASDSTTADPPPPPPPTTTTTTTAAAAEAAAAAKSKKKGLLSRLFSIPSSNKNSLHEEEQADRFDEWTMEDPADASCTICLSDYEDGDLICKLRCDHHFHRDCVHEWLALNFKCPLCQRDFRAEKAENDDDHSH
ncbi:hypothetical protein BCR42DRAFT_410721 [Absidia repens]|uniref:RING-type domain-containing protein n=1 Tax=Absidia repens TaxID=90262 RepID=A0A1X2IPD7_9FUNG|nr:hypothetical protein BCR42DRAFT_410721 [Absidia repens]